MATARTIDRGNGTASPSAFYPDRGTALHDVSFDPSKGTVLADIAGVGVAASATQTSPSRAYTATKRVAVQVQATAPGTVIFETSSDGGTTWPNNVQQVIPAGIAHYGLITPTGGTTHYRTRFIAGQVGVSSLWVTPQQIT